MEQFGTLLPLLIVAIGITVILFGWGGVGKLFSLLLAPIGCLIKAVFTIVVLLVIGFFLLASQYDRLKDLPVTELPTILPTPTEPPPATEIGATRFLRVPFNDPAVTMSEGPRYSDSEGEAHFGAGLSFDYVKGDPRGPSADWQAFPVVAAADGVAIRSCEGADAWATAPYLADQCARGFGHFVLVRHDVTDAEARHYYTLYAHLDPGSIDSDLPQRWRRDTDFANWRRVRAGDYLGMSDQSGLTVCRTDCIHLHFEVYRGGYYRNPIDPYDISTLQDLRTRDAYPEFTGLASCGPETLWIECPAPSLP
jgi:murein DD-endopeptidase MepM/ murein hydrolase activator NlpD